MSSAPFSIRSPLLQRFALVSYTLLLFSGLLVPSDGAHGLLNPKTLSFLLASYSILLYLLSLGKLRLISLKALFALSLFLFFCFVWLSVGLLNEINQFNGVVDQLKLFLITFFFVFYSLLLYWEGSLSFSLFLRLLIYGNGLYICLKIGLIALLILKVVTLKTVGDLTGIKVVSMGITEGLDRFQTSMDIITPFLIYFVLEGEKFGVHISKRTKFFYVVLGSISTFLSFSRLLIGVAFLSISFYFAFHSVSRFIKGLILLALLAGGGIYTVGLEPIKKMIEVRLFSRHNTESDEIRSLQIRALQGALGERPLFGLGMGGYVEEVIRDKEAKHSYEVQWMALWAQLGFLGILFLLLPIGSIVMLYLMGPFSGLKIGGLALFSAWVLAGLTNPFVISLTSGIVYSLFALAPIELNRLKKYDDNKSLL